MSRVKKYKPSKQVLKQVEQVLIRILSAKKDLIKDRPVDIDLIESVDCGLCYNGLNDLNNSYRKALFKSWKHYSGKSLYPVHTSKTLCAEEQFNECIGSKYTGKYGKYRLKLAKHILKKIQKDLKKL